MCVVLSQEWYDLLLSFCHARGGASQPQGVLSLLSPARGSANEWNKQTALCGRAAVNLWLALGRS